MYSSTIVDNKRLKNIMNTLTPPFNDINMNITKNNIIIKGLTKNSDMLVDINIGVENIICIPEKIRLCLNCVQLSKVLYLANKDDTIQIRIPDNYYNDGVVSYVIIKINSGIFKLKTLELEADELEIPSVHYNKPVIIFTDEYVKVMKSLNVMETYLTLEVLQNEVVFSTSNDNLEVLLTIPTISVDNDCYTGVFPFKTFKNFLKMGLSSDSIELYTNPALPLKIVYNSGSVFYVNFI